MRGSESIQIRLPNRMIDYADERAAFFFVSSISSVGSAAYDRRVAGSDNPPDYFEIADVRAINTTMMARTRYAHWTEFTGSTTPLPWLRALDPSWDLFTMGDQDWAANQCEPLILNALSSVMAPYRTTSITTKLLHIKRPRLIPICDSYVTAMIEGRAGNASDTTRLIASVREVGRTNLESLLEIERRLASIGIDRSLVRILDALLWSGFQRGSPEAEFGEKRQLEEYRAARQGPASEARRPPRRDQVGAGGLILGRRPMVLIEFTGRESVARSSGRTPPLSSGLGRRFGHLDRGDRGDRCDLLGREGGRAHGDVRQRGRLSAARTSCLRPWSRSFVRQ